MASITLSGPSSTYTENGSAVTLASTSVFDGAGLPASLDGYELVVALTSNALNSDWLTVDGSGVTLDGRRVLVSGQEVATYRAGTSGQPLRIALNSNANAAAVQTVLRALRYNNFSDDLTTSATRQVSVTLGQVGQTPTVTSTPVSLTVSGVADDPRIYRTQVLYDARTSLLLTDADAALDGPWLAYQDSTQFLGGSATLAAIPGATKLTTDIEAYAGVSNYGLDVNFIPPSADLNLRNNAFPTLDRNAGYVFSFVAALEQEARGAGADKDLDGVDDRAGFSALLLSEDKRGIQLEFWSDRVFAQNDGSSQVDPAIEPDTNSPSDPTRTFFTQGEFVSFDTTQTSQYEVVVQGDSYTLFAEGKSLLTGPLRDYSAFPSQTVTVPVLGQQIVVDVPDPYDQSNFLFLGDLTPLASATVNIGTVSVSTPDSTPEVTVANGQIQNFQPFNIQLPDVEAATTPTTVTLTASSGRFTAVGDGTVAVASTAFPDGSSRLQLNGTLSAINTYLSDPAASLGYQPVSNFSGTVPLEVAFDQAFSPGSNAVSSDFNSDGQSDILLRNASSGDNLVRFMNGVTTLEDGVIGRQIPDINWRFDALGDFNSDQKADIVLRNYNGSGQILLWTMDGANIINETLLGRLVPDPTWAVGGTGDFNGDGQTDILLRNDSSDQNLVWYMNGTSIQSEGLIGRAIGDSSWRMSGTGDFNGDGQADIILRHQSPTGLGQNLVWLMNGSEIAQEVLIGRNVADPNWEIAGSTDFNSDGQSDVLLRNYSTGDNLAWLMNGTSIAQEVALLSVADTQWRAVV